MLNYLKLMMFGLTLSVLSGCTNLLEYWQSMHAAQNLEQFEQRSVNFRPQYRLKAPAREELTLAEKRLLGAPPPKQGQVVLDGATRYYSANGHVCQYINISRYQQAGGRKSACFINGRWVLAAPVLNTPAVR